MIYYIERLYWIVYYYAIVYNSIPNKKRHTLILNSRVNQIIVGLVGRIYHDDISRLAMALFLIYLTKELLGHRVNKERNALSACVCVVFN